MRRPRPIRPKAEPTIALINVVFLLLVFFLIAGQLSPPLDQDIELPSVAKLPPTQAPDALIIAADGSLRHKGQPTTLDAFWQQHAQSKLGAEDAPDPATRLRLIPDRRAEAATLLNVAQGLRDLGARDIWIVTQKGLDQPGPGQEG